MTETRSTELNEQLRQAEKQKDPQASDPVLKSLRRVHPYRLGPLSRRAARTAQLGAFGYRTP